MPSEFIKMSISISLAEMSVSFCEACSLTQDLSLTQDCLFCSVFFENFIFGDFGRWGGGGGGGGAGTEGGGGKGGVVEGAETGEGGGGGGGGPETGVVGFSRLGLVCPRTKNRYFLFRGCGSLKECVSMCMWERNEDIKQL